MATIISLDDLPQNLPLVLAHMETHQERFLIREGDKMFAELDPAPTALLPPICPN